ncbi:MAG: transporter [Bythopirellula sp.]|nr:transporter [Bythopirellula sp.]
MVAYSRIRQLILAIVATASWQVLCAETCNAQASTLMRWNSPLAEEGGPNLDEPMVTDRPDFTEASSTVGRGVIQSENGYTYSFDDDGTDETIGHSYPETLWRIGVLADWLELRCAYNYANEEINGLGVSGSEDLYLGLKLGLTGQAGILPEMALVPQMTVPTGDDSFSSDEVLPGLNWLYSWEVNDFISTAGSTQFNRQIEDLPNEAYTEFAQSWTIGYSLLDDVGAYTEWFVLVPHSAVTVQNEHYFNGGLTVYLTNNVMWDIRAGLGLNDAADDYFVGSGISFRFL